MNKKEISNEFTHHLLFDEKPSVYFNRILKGGILSDSYPFRLLGDLLSVPQNPKYHPEGSVWNHTMLVVDNAAVYKKSSKQPTVLMWSALLHDIGKIKATKMRKGRITAYDHDSFGEIMSKEFLQLCMEDKQFIDSVSKMVKWHMQMLYVLKDLPYADIISMLSEVPLGEISLLCLCDRLGRGNIDNETVEKELKNVEIFKEKCLHILTH